MNNRNGEILKASFEKQFNIHFEQSVLDDYEEVILLAMDEYAKEMAIGFNNWRDGEGWECTLHDDEDIKHWQRYNEGKSVTSDQLYSLYLDSIK